MKNSNKSILIIAAVGLAGVGAVYLMTRPDAGPRQTAGTVAPSPAFGFAGQMGNYDYVGGMLDYINRLAKPAGNFGIDAGRYLGSGATPPAARDTFGIGTGGTTGTGGTFSQQYGNYGPTPFYTPAGSATDSGFGVHAGNR
jgi:hypothetical protein